MQSLTKEEAIKKHRLMWVWIAQTSIQEQRCVTKEEAFQHFGWPMVYGYCWCCEYARQTRNKYNPYLLRCLFCPISWGTETCISNVSYFYLWKYTITWSNDYIVAAKYAYKIAELPEQKSK